ncbi:hypothetical protein BOTNAR_0027g00010 [Botryotinia narcissicola]|uniref:Translocation protein sec66 n=1 Tax=Botryotinia narcissicola TaxID=278944 RepID=A0A4Z1J3E2_9HELO|nr:hypothetical protein BOTNAR_0027g00010 [Botryotinia narcissicola]
MFKDFDYATTLRGLILPFAYVVVLVGSLVTFSSLYRKRIAVKSATLAPWFPPHLQRNIYFSLAHLEPEEGDEKTPKVPAELNRAALLRRAVEDIYRIIHIRTAKQACSTLLQRGSVGDDLWQRFLRAEKEMEEELRDVVMEQMDWHQTGDRQSSSPPTKSTRIISSERASMTFKPEPNQRRSDQEAEAKASKFTSPTKAQSVMSDEDAILVQGGGPAASEQGSPNRKKKGKK